MELNSDLILLQGILNNCVKKTGEFSRINHRGGNEENILFILEELTKFLTERGYFKDYKPKNESLHQLDEIVLFLAINTIFKKSPSLEEYTHLVGIIPKLSKCLLAYICFGLNLLSQYGNVIVTFPLDITSELIDQMGECLSKAKPKEQLKAFDILRAVVKKLSVTEFSNQIEDEVDDIVTSSTEIMRQLSSVEVKYAETMKEIDFFNHMGFILLNILDLLLEIDEKQPIIRRILESLITTCMDILSTVSVHMFCAWVEIEYQDQPLQTIIAGKAYLVSRKYENYKFAATLVSMLSNIAKKPKSLSQLISQADVSTIIKKAGEENVSQGRWFKAMLNLQVFQYKEAVHVLENHHDMCDEEDVLRLLSLNVTGDVPKIQKVILKCASKLDKESLKKVLIRHFYDKGFQWQVDTKEQLVETFNKMGSEIKDLKEVLLLLLQNVPLFFYHLYNIILKGSQIPSNVVRVSSDVALIDNVGLDTLKTVLEESEPSEENIKGYINLFTEFVACEFCNIAIRDVMLPKMESFKENNKLECLKCSIEILKEILSTVSQDTLFRMFNSDDVLTNKLFMFLLTCSAEMRCKSFLEFDGLKSEINSLCISMLMSNDLKKIQHCDYIENKSLFHGRDLLNDPWSNYYKSTIASNKCADLIELVLPNFNLDSYVNGTADDSFTKLMKILPCCTPSEWISITGRIEQKYSFATMVDVVTDIIVLLCDFAQCQNLPGQQIEKLMPPLKYCLQNYGRALGPLASQSKENQILAINRIFRILKHIPEYLRLTEGMSLIQIMPDDTLTSLSSDKEFVRKIVMIGDKQLCKVLAQKVLGSSS